MENSNDYKISEISIYRVTPSGFLKIDIEDSDEYYNAKKNKIPAPHPCPCNGC
jgi:hypothetical protein